MNTEYRYVTLSGDGTIEGHVLDQSNNGYGLPSRSFNIRGGAQPAVSGQLPRPGAHRLLLQPRDQSDAPFEPLRRLEQPADHRRQRRRRLSWELNQRHVRSLRAVLERDRFEPARHRAACVGESWRAAALPELSGVLRHRQRIRAIRTRDAARRGSRGHRTRPVRLEPADSLSLQAVAVVHGEHRPLRGAPRFTIAATSLAALARSSSSATTICSGSTSQ